MADTVYVVKVRYDLDKTGAESAANSLGSTFDRLAKTIAAAFAVHRILDFTKRLVELQSQAETMQTAMATMLTSFGAPGFTNGAKDFEKAMGASSILMTQIRKDAAALPGTAEELMEAVRAVMPSGIATGKSVMGQDSILEMGKRLMVAATPGVLNIPGGITTVAREFQAILEGRTQGRNDLFARLRGLMQGPSGGPISAKEMNRLSEQERWDLMDKTLKKLIDASLPTLAKQWKSISDTTINWVQQLARVASGGLFETLKRHLNDLNVWFEKNQASIEQFARSFSEALGEKFGQALDALKNAFEFVVQNKGALIAVAQAFGALAIGSKLASGFGGGKGILGGLGNMASGAGLAYALNGITGGDSLTGILMGVSGALLQFGGVVGGLAASFIALQAATNLLTEAIDKEHKSKIDKNVESQRLMTLYKTFEQTGELGFQGTNQYAIAKNIIQQYKLNAGYMGSIDNQRFAGYVGGLTNIDLAGAASARKMFESVAGTMRLSTPMGPYAPTAEQKLQQLLFEKGKGIAEKPKVDITVNIKQDISQAEDPDRILVRTKQAIEDALIRPIESGNNRFSVMR